MAVVVVVGSGVPLKNWTGPMVAPSEAPMTAHATGSSQLPIPLQTDIYAVPPGHVHHIPRVIGPVTATSYRNLSPRFHLDMPVAGRVVSRSY